VLDRVCHDAGGETTVVVGTESEAAMVGGACAVPVIVSPQTVQFLRVAGYQLPVIISTVDGRISGIGPGANTEGARS